MKLFGTGRIKPVGINTQVLIVVALFVFAVAQPILDLLGRHPEFFVARDSLSYDPVMLAAVLCLLLPLLLGLGLLLLSRVHTRIAGIVFYSLVLCFSAMIVLQLIKDQENFSSEISIVLSLLAGGLLVLLVRSSDFVRRFICICVIAAVVAPVNFIFLTDTLKIVLPEEETITQSGAVPKRELPVIVIIFDALPLQSLLNENGEIDRRLFPGFSELADRSTWYPNATTVSFETLTAVPAVLSGRLPDSNRLPTLSHYPQNLFTLLSPGYQFYAYEPYTQLCPDKRCDDSRTRLSFKRRLTSLFEDVGYVYLHLLLPNDMTGTLPSVTTDWKYFAAKDGQKNRDAGKKTVSKKARARSKVAALELDNFAELFQLNLDKMQQRNQGTLYFQHLLLPHIPWRYLPSGKQYLKSHDLGIERTGRWVDDEQLVMTEYHRHLLQLMFVDSLIAKLLRRLDEASIFDEALLVVTADHGASFRPGEFKRRAGTENLLDIASVPLFVKYPGQKGGGVSHSLAQTIDILPTVAEVVGAELTGSLEGAPLLSGTVKDREQISVFHLPREFRFGRDQIAHADPDPLLLKVKKRMVEDSYNVGEWSGLTGTPEPVDGRRSDSLQAMIVDHPAYQAVDLDAPFIPARVMGSIKGYQGDGRLPLAIALNGQIAATTTTYRNDSGELQFSAVISPDRFVSGENSLRIYAIDQSIEGTPVLSLLPSPGNEKYRLARTEQGYEIQRGEQSYVVTPTSRKNPVRGYVDNAISGQQITSITGWGADSRPQGEQVEILLFNGESLVASTRTTSVRVDVARAFGIPRLKYAGFGFHIPTHRLPEPGEGDLRLFIVTGDGVATELVYDKNYLWRK